MTEHSLSLVRADRQEAVSNRQKSHALEQLNPQRIARRLTIFQPSEQVMDDLLEEASCHIPGLASSSVVRRVLAHNPRAIWAFARKSSFNPADPKGEGFQALLLLTEQGLNELAARTLDCSDPPSELLAKPGERPAGIYVWATYAPGTLAAAVTLVVEAMSAPPYDAVPVFTRASTKDGSRFTEVLGFRKGTKINGIDAPHLYVYERSREKLSNAPIYDSYIKGNDRRTLSIAVARSVEDWMRAASVRSAVYIGEQECPFDEEFDGNDFSAIHLIGYSGDEPAGCIRIRHFADFAKVERLAVRKEFRHSRLSFLLVRAAIELCRVKGYRRIYGHAQRRLLGFWRRFGAIPLPGGKEFAFSDFDYVEVMVEIEPHPNPITIGTDPYVIIRPEGRWHVPGVLERSASRPVTCPSIGKPVS